MTYQSLQKILLDTLGLSREEMEELQYIIFLISDEKMRDNAINKLTQNPNIINKLIDFIKRKGQFLGEINEPGWDKIIDEQKKIVKSLMA
ncbi:MAG: hypothetical protein PHN39_01430 [Candidatus Pacebacteria bacterium]|nr:hypothetical protein [Candidatus Paceibacterota bacterium]